jgi:hypothetical protein
MRNLFSTLLVIAAAMRCPAFPDFAGNPPAGTVRVIPYTTDWSQRLLLSRGQADALGMLFVMNATNSIVVSASTNCSALVASTNSYFPSVLAVELPPGVYHVECAVSATASTRGWECGFGSTNGVVLVASNQVATPVFASGMLTVSSNSWYGFFIRQLSPDPTALPAISSNSVCWIYKVQ